MDNNIENHSRTDYVLVWTPTESQIIQRGYCSLCRISYKGNHCPDSTRCAKSRDFSEAFNNTKHIIIATKDFCRGKHYGCTKTCSDCVLPNTYKTVKLIT